MTQDELTSAQVADLLRVHISTVNRAAAAGKLPAVRKLPGLRGPRLFKAEVVETFRQQLTAA